MTDFFKFYTYLFYNNGKLVREKTRFFAMGQPVCKLFIFSQTAGYFLGLLQTD